MFFQRYETEREFQPNFCKHCCVCASLADLENVTNFSIFCVFTLVSGDVHCAMCKLDSVHFCRFSLWKTASQTGFKEERRESVWHWLLWLWTLCIRWRGQPGAVSAGNFEGWPEHIVMDCASDALCTHLNNYNYTADHNSKKTWFILLLLQLRDRKIHMLWC